METKNTQTEKDHRESFRVNDYLAVIIHKTVDQEALPSLEPDIDIFEEIPPPVISMEGINPYLWKMMDNLHKKLDLILERLPIDLMKINAQPVNLSSTGIKVKVKKQFNLGEEVKIKLLLPTLPVKEFLLFGKVNRVLTCENGEYEVAFQFHNVDDEVREEIIQYNLKQQRKAILAQRQQRGKDESLHGKIR